MTFLVVIFRFIEQATS